MDDDGVFASRFFIPLGTGGRGGISFDSEKINAFHEHATDGIKKKSSRMDQFCRTKTATVQTRRERTMIVSGTVSSLLAFDRVCRKKFGRVTREFQSTLPYGVHVAVNVNARRRYARYAFIFFFSAAVFSSRPYPAAAPPAHTSDAA